MICPLCSEYITSMDKKSMMVQGTKYNLHKKCLRKATKTDLIEKGLIKPNDNIWWTRLGGD